MDNLDPAAADSPVQLSPTAGYYIRKLLRHQGVASPVDPTADLTTILRQHYADPLERQGKIEALERLAHYHQVVSAQGSQHPEALRQTEQEILQLLESPAIEEEAILQNLMEPTAAFHPFSEASPDALGPKGLVLRIDEKGITSAPLTALLQQRGYQLKTLCHGVFTLADIQNARPDAIVIHLKMSDDGIELCQSLRNCADLRFVPIIMVSAFHNVSDRLKALKLGVADYLSQPVEPEEMLARLENHIQFQQYRKQLEQENRQLRANLKTSSAPNRAAMLAQVVLNQSSDYLLFIQSDNTIVYANESACRQLGYGNEELLNTPIDTLDVGLAPQDWETIWAHLRAHAALSLGSVHITKSGDALDVLLDLQYLQVQGEEFSYIAAKLA